MDVQGIIDILAKQTRIYEKLFQLAKEKTEAIKVNDIDTLNRITEQEQVHVAELQRLESERAGQMEKAAGGNGSLTLSELLQRADEKDLLQKTAEELSDILKKLKEANELNQELLYHSLQFIHFSLSLIQPGEPASGYGPGGNHKAPERRQSKPLLNTKV
ncbi:flagellar protein FlgN [Caldibacillus debilis]|uniref:Flagellar protein FlgN n=1 Tax=Caldibacillus debilis TaxID=301148 RepID=A0A150MC50_9BACI|nr:flagellar protein FlgN [Caldibacillus debilis]KYD22157.1 hypothetical protein B4135_1502 [Caldibacillus debilis]